MERLKAILDSKVLLYNRKDFIINDPVSFPHYFKEKRDIEIASLLASVIAWGNRTMILRSGRKMFFDIMDGKPYDFIMKGIWNSLDESANIHRTFFVRDFVYLCRGLQYIYERTSTLEDLFIGCSTWDGIQRLRNELSFANDGNFTRHISNPAASAGRPASACKRMHMMLRWLCRQDGVVDLGVWKDIPSSQLMIPLDVHVARTGRQLGLITRKLNDRKTVEELTAALRLMCPDDPIKYDFALFGVGVEGDTFIE